MNIYDDVLIYLIPKQNKQWYAYSSSILCISSEAK